MPKKKKLLEELLGLTDSRSTRGIFTRGANVYKGGLPAAHSGVDPRLRAARRRLKRGVVR